MERAGFHAPLVVENRPFILVCGNLNGICGAVWSEFASHAMLRRGSADGQEEGGAEGQVGGAGAARNRR